MYFRNIDDEIPNGHHEYDNREEYHEGMQYMQYPMHQCPMYDSCPYMHNYQMMQEHESEPNYMMYEDEDEDDMMSRQYQRPQGHRPPFHMMPFHRPRRRPRMHHHFHEHHHYFHNFPMRPFGY